MASVVVCGGSIIGLSTAMLLARDEHEVTVLESDRASAPEVPAAAWEAWDRKGVPQFRQPHNLFPRARQVLDDDLPGMTDVLLAAGCTWIDPLGALPPFITDREPRPDDDRFRYVTGRRPVVEAAFAHAATWQPGVTVRRGTVVRELLSHSSSSRGARHIHGVRLDTGEELLADLVVDATGRRTKLPEWLSALGSRPPDTESYDSGFVYYTRYFTGEHLPAFMTAPLVPFGSVSLLTIHGDNGTWSVTVFGSSADPALKKLRDPERFTAVVRACPLHAHWLDGSPITDVVVMAGILDRYRRYVIDDEPIATGVVPVGDAWACTNPSAGRGITVGLVHAQRLRDVTRAGMDDPDDLVRRFDAVTQVDVAPFFRNQIAFDRFRFAEMNALQEGFEPPAPDRQRVTIMAAMVRDPDVFRQMMETITCLSLPEEVFARPEFIDKVQSYAGEAPVAVPGPDRAVLLELLG